MASVIRKVIPALDAASRPAATRAKHVRVSGQVAAENAPAANVGDSSAIVAQAATAVSAPRPAPTATHDASPKATSGFLGMPAGQTECNWCTMQLKGRVSSLFSQGMWYCDWKCRSDELKFEAWEAEANKSTTASGVGCVIDTAKERAKARLSAKEQGQGALQNIVGWNMDFIVWHNERVKTPAAFETFKSDSLMRDLSIVKLLASLYAWDSEHKLFAQAKALETEAEVEHIRSVSDVARVAFCCTDCWELESQCQCGDKNFIPLGIIGGE